jgi:hypothetical protein
MLQCANRSPPCRESGLYTIGTTLLGSYGRLFLGAFMPVVESVAPDLGDCNHGGVACLGISFAEKGHALDPAEEIVSLSPPVRAALILHTEVTPYEAGTEFTVCPNSGSGPTTERKRAAQISTTDPVRQRDARDRPCQCRWQMQFWEPRGSEQHNLEPHQADPRQFMPVSRRVDEEIRRLAPRRLRAYGTPAFSTAHAGQKG